MGAARDLGRKLEDRETLHDAVSKILSEWDQRQATFQSIRASISISNLKAKTKRKGILPPDVGNEKALNRFTLIPSSERPVEVLDCRGNLIAFRCSVPIDLIANLERTEAMLPRLKAQNTGRGLFPHRHYAAWGDFATEVYHSKEYRDDLPHSQNWLDANRALWDYLSNLLRLVRPEMWKTANNFKYLKEKHLAGAWSGMAINQDTKDGDVHQDWQDSQRMFNCVVPFGIFSAPTMEREMVTEGTLTCPFLTAPPPGKSVPTVSPDPRPIVQPTVQCPVQGWEVTFAGKNNLRAITIHVKGIVKKGRAYYVLRRQGGGFWDAHHEYYQYKRSSEVKSFYKMLRFG
jgi:hypothetical protein